MIHVRQFGGGSAEGRAKDKALLGGKGANLAEMASLGLPVPPGFTITTEVCRHVMAHGEGSYPDGLEAEVSQALARVEELTQATFGDATQPLLLSVRSGAPASMPGMMDTILNLGLNDTTVEALATQAGNAWFAWDCYRRFVAMYGEVVLGVTAAEEHDPEPFDTILDDVKRKYKANRDQDLSEAALREAVQLFKAEVLRVTGAPFPDDVKTQLWGAIGAVFRSWGNPRADAYRKMYGIPETWGTAVNVQAMVFGNLGDDCATGVAFTRNPATGTAELYGEFLTNAQGEDVVAGIRNPEPIAELAKTQPAAHAELVRVAKLLEDHFRDMQDLEFTIQKGQLFMLQTRTGKRTGKAMVKVAVDLVAEGKLTPREAVLRIDPAKLDEVLHPTIDPKARPPAIGKGLPASPGAAIGRVVFTAGAAEEWAAKGERVLLVRTDTSPEDIHGMKAAAGILTSRGGMTCIAGETTVLTDRGVLAAETVFDLLEHGERLRILSFDSKTLTPVWRDIIAAGRKPSQVISVSVSQTGRADDDVVRITDDHKAYVLRDRELVKQPIKDVLEAEEHVLVVDHVPGLGDTAISPSLAYVAGALLSDGYIKLGPTKGPVTFIQKRTEDKLEFIAAVEQAFLEAFEVPFSYLRQRETVATRSEVQDRICFRRAPAERLAWIRDNLTSWVLTLDRTALRFFLAGYVDGAGSYAEESSAIRLQITVSAEKPDNLRGVVLACLRLGIVPQVTRNRDAFNVQIAEQIDEILAFTHRVLADVPERKYESKCFSVRGLFDDIVDQINFMGRVREGIKRNLMFGAEKIRRDVLPLCNGEQARELSALLDSSLRSYRAKQVAGHEPAMVYNFEVDATDELDKNFVVFTSRLTPILVSNSHAAVVARGMGKCCVTSCTSLRVDAPKKTAVFAGGALGSGKELRIKEGDMLTLDGSTGEVYSGTAPLVPAQLGSELGTLMTWVDQFRTLKVRTNADTPTDARTARSFGAEGIGLCRTEHMFFQPERLLAVREMILAADEAGRRAALAKILPMQRSDFAELFRVMDGLPVTVRLLDPPLHEFLPHTPKDIDEVAQEIGTSAAAITAKVQELTEANPMLGHRGCRLGITFPEIYEIQTQAIAEAALEVARDGVTVLPEIMIPLVMVPEELRRLRELVARTVDRVLAAASPPAQLAYTIGTMIELPRACVVADRIAEHADFFSFGTNDLTQTTFGLSRDDAGRFLPSYIDSGVLAVDPFVALDADGVGALIELGVRGGRATKPGLKIGICGEHGGEPSSVELCHRAGFDYVSCSPFRVPIARVAAARAALASEAPSK